MAKGIATIKRAKEEINKRKSSGGGGNFRKKLILRDGDQAVVRILEEGEDLTFYYAHYVDTGKKWPEYVPCRDQDMETGDRIGEECPGCDGSFGSEGSKRKFRVVFNVIWRNAPIFEPDEDTGKIDWSTPAYHEDSIALAEFGSEFADDIIEKQDDYNGLRSRDWKIKRRGNNRDTKYSMNPADPDGGKTSLSDNDNVLEENKYDLNEIIAAPAYDIWGKTPAKREDKDTPSEASAFLRKRS